MASNSSADTDIDTTDKASADVDTSPQSSTEQARETESAQNHGLTIGTICVLAGGLIMMWIVSNMPFPQPAFDSIQWYALFAFVIIYWAIAIRWIHTQNFKPVTK